MRLVPVGADANADLEWHTQARGAAHEFVHFLTDGLDRTGINLEH